MAIVTTFRLADPFGNHLIDIADYSRADYVLNCAPGAIGVLELTLDTSFDASLIRYDGRIGIWRSIGGAPPYLDAGAIFLIQTIRTTATSTFVRAYHATQLMERRIISYAAGTAYTSKAGYADNLIKAFWRENAGASISAANRDGPETQADISLFVSCQADLSVGWGGSTKAATRRNLLETATEIAEDSAANGTYLTFEIMAPTESTLELRTYAGMRGVDHTAGSGDPVILSEARGNLEHVELTIDYRDLVTVAVGGGRGEGVEREIDVEVGSSRMARSPFGRREVFVDSSNSADINELTADTIAAVRTWRELTLFTASLVETPGTMRGIQFDLGDMVTAEHPRTGQQFDVRIDVIHETIDENGRTVQIGLRSADQ